MVASNYSIMVNKGSDKKSVLPVYHDDEIDYETKMNRFDSDSEAEEEEFGYDSGVPSMLKHVLSSPPGGSDVNVQGEGNVGTVAWAYFLLFLSFVIIIYGGLYCANTLVPTISEDWGTMIAGAKVALGWVLKLAAVGGSVLLWIVGYFCAQKCLGGNDVIAGSWASEITKFFAIIYVVSLVPFGCLVMATLLGDGMNLFQRSFLPRYE